MYNSSMMMRHGLAVQNFLRKEFFNTACCRSVENIQDRLYSTRTGKYDKRLAKNKPNRKKINAAILARKKQLSKADHDQKRHEKYPAKQVSVSKDFNIANTRQSVENSKHFTVNHANDRQVRYDTLKVILSSNPQNQAAPNRLPRASKDISEGKSITQKEQNAQLRNSHRGDVQPKNKQKQNVLHPHSPKKSGTNQKIKYEALQKYITKVCKNVMLEEKLSIEQQKILTLKDFELVWFEEPGEQTRAYTLKILMTPEFLDRFLSKKLQQVGTMPICNGQTMLLMADDKTAWYGTVIWTEIENLNKENYRDYSASKKPHNLKIDVRLFDFNLQPLPTGTDVHRLQILPASLQTSRMFKALTDIKKSTLRDIILGKKLIPSSHGVPGAKAKNGKSGTVLSIMNNPVTIVPRAPNIDPIEANCNIIKELFENGMRPIIVISASNKSLDSMCEKLLPEYEDSILRIISASKENLYHKDHKVHSICLHNIVYGEVPTRIKSLIRRMTSPYTSLTPVQYRDVKNALIPHSDRVIAERDIIFTTPVSADGVYFRNYKRKPIVVMDDARQSSEATTLIPLLLRGFLRFVLIGDPQDSSCFSQVPDMSFSHFRSVLNGR